MGQKYDKAIQRINDIKDAFSTIAKEYEDTKVSLTAYKKAAEYACALEITANAIEGDLVDQSPEEVARGILASGAFIDIVGSLAEQ